MLYDICLGSPPLGGPLQFLESRRIMPRPTATWKKWERWWAELLGGVRVPVTGRTRGTAPDVSHDKFAIEVKYGNVMSTRLSTAVEQAVAAHEHSLEHEGVDKIPLVCITNRTKVQRLDHYVLMRAEDFVKWTNSKKQSTTK